MNSLVQRLRRDICAVRPNDRTEIRIYADLLKVFVVAQRLENGTVERSVDIDIALRTVFEFDPDGVLAHLPNFDDVRHRLLHRLLPLLRRALPFRRPLRATLIRLLFQAIADRAAG
jgi:hypothetical protein